MQPKKKLSPSQAQFAAMLNRAPFLLPLWDMDRAEYIPELVDNYLATASRGEAIMARFFLGVWLSRNQFDFDFTDAAAVLERENMRIITDWMSEPFWP